MNTVTNIIITTQFEALHRWKGCHIVSKFYLKDFHRHVFHVKMKARVSHNERDIEFIDLKEQVIQYIRKNYEYKALEMSCETIATQLKEAFSKYSVFYVSVMEDNENGAEVCDE